MRLARLVLIFAALAVVVVPVALALRFTDDSFKTPKGIVGQPYSHKFDGAGGCGPDPATGNAGLPYQFSVQSGGLPPGLVLERNGLLHGTPTQAGDYSFWVELSDEDPPSASWCTTVGKAQRQFTVSILPGIAITTNDAPDGSVGSPYNLALAASGTSSATWTLVSGILPGGLVLGSNGVISGTPTTAGAYAFTVKLADGDRAVTKSFKITIFPQLVVTAPKLPAGAEVGIAFTAPAATATGGVPPYKWSGTLPAGLVIDATTAVVSGTPKTGGSFTLKLVATDARGTAVGVDVPLTIAKKLTLVAPKKIKIGEVGHDYSLTVEKEGGIAPLKWTISGLPTGLTFDKETGEVSGTPKKAGDFTLSIGVTDAAGASAETLEIPVTIAPKLKILTRKLHAATVGKRYSESLAVRGGAGKVKFKITGGRLPVGVRLNRATGAFVGSPRVSGKFAVTVTATDGLGVTSTQTIVLNVLS